MQPISEDEPQAGWLGRLRTVGIVVVGLGILFGAMNGVPWASKAEVELINQSHETQITTLRDDLRGDIRDLRQEVEALHTDVRELRAELRGWSPTPTLRGTR